MAVFVIAEGGCNHGGSISTAWQLAEAAKDAGADAVKFQHFNSRRLWGDDRITHLELSDAEMVSLTWRCKEIDIEFMCTPFGVQEVEFLTPLVKRWKVASGCLTRWDLLAAVRATGLPVILSTGMSDMDRIQGAVDALGAPTLLHCTSAYPCPAAEVNLTAMDALRARWGASCPVGYSDHTVGIVIALAAVAMGATVIEKHLTLDRQAEGPDHKASIEPKEFRVMIEGIRDVEQALGDGRKRVMKSEEPLRRLWHVAPKIDRTA